MTGRRLTAAWLAWNADDDTWFTVAPVVLDFEGGRVELNHCRPDELSVTWNGVDLAGPALGLWGETRLVWRDDSEPRLAALVGRILDVVEVQVLDIGGRDLADGTASLRFRFGEVGVTVFNALDQNGLDCDDRAD